VFKLAGQLGGTVGLGRAVLFDFGVRVVSIALMDFSAPINFSDLVIDIRRSSTKQVDGALGTALTGFFNKPGSGRVIVLGGDKLHHCLDGFPLACKR
jgi:hypothetical protein